jgi:hypothetical protein
MAYNNTAPGAPVGSTSRSEQLHNVNLNEKAPRATRLDESISPSSTRKEDEKGWYINPLTHNQVAAAPPKRSAMSKLKGLFRKRKETEDDDDDDEDDIVDVEQARASAHIDPANDTTDPTPFFQKPLVLASLVDPKSLSDLEAMGGSDGLLHGLGVDGTKGLNVDGSASAGAVSGQLDAQYRASQADRMRVYGDNILPTKKTKSLLQLMWMAMKDKVLVSSPPWLAWQ